MADILLAGLPYGLESIVARALTADGHGVAQARTAREAFQMLQQSPAAVLIMFTDLPDGDGDWFCSELRSVPADQDLIIILLTDRDSLADRLRGFSAGADDAIVVPFHIPELVVRVNAYLRRTGQRPAAEAHAYRQCGSLVLDRQTGEVWLGGQRVALTPVETRLLDYLMACAGRPVAAEELLCHVWKQHPGTGDPGLVRVHMRHLREKLQPAAAARQMLRTISGFGYALIIDGAP